VLVLAGIANTIFSIARVLLTTPVISRSLKMTPFMDIHAKKCVDIGMDGKFHIHGNRE